MRYQRASNKDRFMDVANIVVILVLTGCFSLQVHEQVGDVFCITLHSWYLSYCVIFLLLYVSI